MACKHLLAATFVLLPFFVVNTRGQSPTDATGLAEQTQPPEAWIDPSTGLMWAGKDNDKDVSWRGAVKYCRDLHLAGYSDWKLANIGELESIYDESANSPGRAGPRDKSRPFTWHVKGNLFLTGLHWSSSLVLDNRGRPTGYASRWDFNQGRVFDGDELWFSTGKRALCVRRSKK